MIYDDLGYPYFRRPSFILNTPMKLLSIAIFTKNHDQVIMLGSMIPNDLIVYIYIYIISIHMCIYIYICIYICACIYIYIYIVFWTISKYLHDFEIVDAPSASRNRLVFRKKYRGYNPETKYKKQTDMPVLSSFEQIKKDVQR